MKTSVESSRRHLPIAQAHQSSPRPSRLLTRREELPGFHVLAKPSGAICNLNCEYCFFLSKESLYPGSRFRMSDAVLEAYIEQLLAAHRGPEITIAWQGGEPTLMGLDFFARALALVDAHVRPGTRVSHTLQTNGILLDDAWCSFFREHDFLIGLSVDGPKPLHDAYRVDRGGNPTFDRVMRAAQRLRRHDVSFNILCTVHAANSHHPLEVYRFFRDDLGARHLQFIPIVERCSDEAAAEPPESRSKEPRGLYRQEGHRVTERSVLPDAWGRFLVTIFDEWFRHDVGDVFVQMFESALASWLGLPPSLCVFAETCGDALALEHNGDLYSCDHYVEPDYLLGNIRERHMLDLVTSEKQRAFGEHKKESLPAYCRSCDVLFACNGECPRNRFASAPDNEPGLNYLCAGYKTFFRHIDPAMHTLADLVRRGDDPSRAYAIFRSRQSRTRSRARRRWRR